jgi:nitrous oxidase accessory protein NosD
MSERFTRFGVHGGKLLALSGRNIEVTDSDFLSAGCCLYVTRARGALIANNRFRMDRFGWYWLSGCDGVIMEDNELLGADLSTWGGGINTLDGSNYSQNIYFARNRLAFYYDGDHEAITTDGSGAAYFTNKPSAIDVTARPRGDAPGFFTVGTIVRGNRLLNNAVISIGAGNPPTAVARNPWLRDVIVEHNEVRDNEVGIAVADQVEGVLIRDNRFQNVAQEVMDIADSPEGGHETVV